MAQYRYFKVYTGDAVEADADTVERLTGVEIGYIGWATKKDGKFENVDREVYLSPQSGYPIGTEDLFAKWSRTRKR